MRGGGAIRGLGVGRAPLLLAFEDLHQSDVASLELIAYTGRRLSSLPVLLVLTRRKLPSRLDLDAVLGALRSRGAVVTEIAVGPLTDAAARALVEASADLPPTTVAQIVTMAAGSPLLAVETARAAARDDANLAAGLGGAARLAIGRLSGQARVFVEFLAAAGRDLDRREIASLPLRSPALAAAEALGSGLLRADGGAWGSAMRCCAKRSTWRSPTPSGHVCTVRSPSCCATEADRQTPVGCLLEGLAVVRARPRSPATSSWPARMSRPLATWSWPRTTRARWRRWRKPPPS